MSTPSPRGTSHLPVAILGLITIAVYGCWTYSFGVLLDPIVTDTGWSELGIVTAFSVSAGIAGLGSMIGGWALDRWGSRVVFGVAAIFGTIAFWAGANASTATGFTVLSSLGGGVFGALGFYHVTQTVAARVGGPSPTRSITALTVWGAFAGAIYLPLTAWLIDLVGWRDTLTIITASAGAMLAIGAVAVATDTDPQHRITFLSGLGKSLAVPGARWFMLAVGLAGIAISVLVVYQVPLMTAAGLTLATASSIAGARSIAQLLGRLPLAPIVGRLGANGAMQLSFVAIAAGCLIVIIAGSVAMGVLFAVVAGFGIGSMSPLTGINSVELFPAARLGVGRGTIAAAGSAAGAIGPLLGSGAVALSGSRSAAAVVAAGAGFAAVWAMRLAGRHVETRVGTQASS